MDNSLFSERVDYIQQGDIHKNFQITKRAKIISFAAGNPATELFPIEELKKASYKVLDENGVDALQYSIPQGDRELRNIISNRMLKFKVNTSEENILITSGSQQSLDITGKIFIDKGDIILCERPTFLGFIESVKVYGPKFKGISMNKDGIDLDELESVVKKNKNIKFLYTIPSFQNPTGITMDIEKRKRLVELANKYDFIIIEDNAYGELSFNNECLPAIKSFDTEGRVVFLGSFSKVIAPGLRISWICADKQILEKYMLFKQTSDLHTDILTQMIIARYINDNDIEKHVLDMNRAYEKRKNIMVECMKKEFPSNVKYYIPEGGIFIWIEVPQGASSLVICQKALEENVLLFAGELFYPDKIVNNTFRLNFTSMTEKDIVDGIKILGKILKENI